MALNFSFPALIVPATVTLHSVSVTVGATAAAAEGVLDAIAAGVGATIGRAADGAAALVDRLPMAVEPRAPPRWNRRGARSGT